MATNKVLIAAPVATVFGVLLDPETYRYWVVGAKEVRQVDADWPAPGSAFHHGYGAGPLVVRDKTVVLDVDEPRLLVLEARAFPIGTAKVVLHLAPHAGGTLVHLREEPLRGLAARVDNPLLDAATWARNLVSVRRLRAVAETRHRAAAPATGVPL